MAQNTTNKEWMLAIMEAMAGGSSEAFFDAMADTVTWRWMGVEDWSRVVDGKEAVLGELLAAWPRR